MAEAARHYTFNGRINKRRCPEVNLDGHISIENLRNALQDDTNVKQIKSNFRWDYELKILSYLTNNNIPNYPKPVEFHISEVTHVTDEAGFNGIMKSGGFKANEKFSWWSLKIDEDILKAAQENYLIKVFPNRSQEQIKRQEPFLSKFTTSPAFDIDRSRYGNFQFTFSLEELMETYKEKICGGQDPVLREYKTFFYQKEIVYVVLVHSPEVNEQFVNFQKIEKSDFVDYRNNQIIWKAQAICEEFKWKLILNENDKIASTESAKGYYVWDFVSLAFHFDDVLTFPVECLEKSFTNLELADKKEDNMAPPLKKLKQ